MFIDGPPVRTLRPAPDPTKELDSAVEVATAPASVVSDYIAPRPGRHLPQMLLATTFVAVFPLVASLALRATGVISGWVSVGVAVVMSLATSTAGSAYWRKRGGHGEVLFSELLLWGWLRSWRQERELANATRLLDLVNTGSAEVEARGELSIERREQLLRQLAGALEGQDLYLNGHSRRVARHATMIARGMGLSSQEVARIRAAAAVHDVGKLRTPKTILNKPGRLTDAEFEVIKRHPGDGAEIVAALGDPELTRIVRHHHERLDGAGYPDRLRGEEIPVGARIIAVADTFDAITSARPYRDAAPHQKAIDILRNEAGTQLDPEAVKAFLAYYTGNRPALIWAIITSSVRRVVAWLSGDPAAAATISAGKVAAATVATATIGAVAVAAPVPVVHHAHRPVAAYAVMTPPRGAATSLRRSGVGATVPAPNRAAVTRTAKSASATARRAAHPAGATRHAKAKSAGSNHSRGHAAAPFPLSNAGSSQAAARSQGAVSSSAPGSAANTNQRAAVSPSQGSSANGNAYGHTKPPGNGHGQGVANGHASPAPSVGAHPSPNANGAAHANPTASVPITVPNSASQGNAGSNGNASSQGNAGGQLNAGNQGNAATQDNAGAPGNQSRNAGGSAPASSALSAPTAGGQESAGGQSTGPGA